MTEPRGFSWTNLLSAVVAEGGTSLQRDISYGPEARQKLDVYVPSPPKQGQKRFRQKCAAVLPLRSRDNKGLGSPLDFIKSRKPLDPKYSPIILYAYGGSWRQGDKQVYRFLGAALARRGISMVVPDYRLFPTVRFPEFVEDLAMAYAWVVKNLAKSGDTWRPIILMGHSAGAHMAALLALDPSYLNQQTDEDLPKPTGLIGLAGPYVFDPTTYPSTMEIFAKIAHADTARPVAFAGPHAPPTLLLHGSNDETVKPKASTTFAAALLAQKVDVTHVTYDGIGHIGILLTLSRLYRWRAPALQDILQFVHRLTAQ